MTPRDQVRIVLSDYRAFLTSPIGRWLTTIIGLLTLWMLIAAACDGGWPQVKRAYWFCFITGSIIVGIAQLIFHVARSPAVGLFTAGALASVIWFYVSDSYRTLHTLLWDAGGFVLGLMLGGLVLAIFGFKASQLDAAPSRRQQYAFATVVPLFGWLGITLLSMVHSHKLPTDPERFEKQLGPAHSIVREYADRWDGLRIGLTLSGGGYRAALFHAGGLHALERLGIRVDNLATVSGGSIFGAYYAIGGDPEKFRNAVSEGRMNLKREALLAHNVARLIFPARVPGSDVELLGFYRFNRADVQAALLNKTLFDEYDLATPLASHQPELLIAVTDLTYGMLVGMVADGIITLGPEQIPRVYRNEAYSPQKPLGLARRVAISGAFPVAFPAYGTRMKVVSPTSSGQGYRPMQLADGGIGDNLGLYLIKAADALACRDEECLALKDSSRFSLGRNWALDAILVSDASAIFGVRPENAGLEALSRAFDVSTRMVPTNQDHSPKIARFSAQDAYSNVEAQFRLYEDRTEASSAQHRWNVHFDPRLDYPPSVLQAIVELLPAQLRADASRDLDEYLEVSDAHVDLRAWTREFGHMKDRDDCERSAGVNADLKALPGICAAVGLRDSVRAEVARALDVFEHASTLESVVSTEDADTLFRLGEFLIYLRWPALCDTLDNAVRHRAGLSMLPRSCGHPTSPE